MKQKLLISLVVVFSSLSSYANVINKTTNLEIFKENLNTNKLNCTDPTDSDGDGLTDCEETTGIDDPSTPLEPGTLGVDPMNPSDPNNPCDPIGIFIIDSDGDGLTDCEEITGIDDPSTPLDPWFYGGTSDPYDPCSPIGINTTDSDGDGLTDCEEVTGQDDPSTTSSPTGTSDPNDPCSPIGISTIDSDGDGLTDCEEVTGIDDPSTPLEPGNFGGISDPNDGCSPIVDANGCTPTANDDTATTFADTNITIPVTINDSDPNGTINVTTIDLDPSTPGQQSTIIIPGDGAYTDNGDGTVTFDPDPGFNGISTITYTVNDNDGNTSNPAVITITIEDCPNTTDTDGDGLTDCEETTGIDDPSTTSVPSGTSNPLDTCDPIGINTTDTDGDGLTDCEETTGVNDPSTPLDPGGNTTDPADPCDPDGTNCAPVAVDDFGLTTLDMSTIIDLIANDSDPNGTIDGATINITTPGSTDTTSDGFNDTLNVPGEGVYITNPDGTLFYNPEFGFSGATSSISYTVNDNEGNTSNSALITVIIDVCLDPIDTDGDGLTDCEETTGVDDPNSPCSPFGNITNPNVPNLTCANGEIKVYAFLDSNTNGTFETGEQIISNSGSFTYELNDDGIEQTISSSNNYIFILDDDITNSYDITFNYSAQTNCYMPSNTIENVSIVTGNSSEYYIPITSIPCDDISVDLWPDVSPRPGFDYFNHLMIRNLGTTVSSGTVEFIHDPLVSFVSVISLDSGNTITQTPTGFILNYNNLQPSGYEFISIQMYLDPTINLGELITNTAIYNAPVSEIDTTNDIASLTEVVIGSYDPNDKMESHGEDILYDDFVVSNEYLYYTVRFQNVGTAEAITVRIEDTLDPLLDASTFEMIQSSHDYQVNRDDNQLTWTFNDINLPAESQDADGSNGFVYFKIKPLAGYTLGTVIPARAEIYFDFNAPVITNTFETTFIEEVLSLDSFEIKDFIVHPNPAKESVQISINSSLSDKAEIAIYDLRGRKVLAKSIKKTLSTQIDLSGLNSGVYLLKLKDRSNEIVKKLIIK